MKEKDETKPNASDAVSLRVPRYIYIGVWALVAVLAVCDIAGLLPDGAFSPTAEERYAADVLCIALTLGCSWAALRLFAVKRVRESVGRNASTLTGWNIARTALLAVPILLNLVLALSMASGGGYGALGGNTQVYCLLVALIAFLFCWPKHGETGAEGD